MLVDRDARRPGVDVLVNRARGIPELIVRTDEECGEGLEIYEASGLIPKRVSVAVGR